MINVENSVFFQHSMLDVRPARNALKLVQGQFNHLIYISMVMPTHRTMHSRRVFFFFQ